MTIKKDLGVLVLAALSLTMSSCSNLNKYDATKYGYTIDYITPEQKEAFTKRLKKHFHESYFTDYGEFLAAVDSCGKLDAEGKPNYKICDGDLNAYLSSELNNHK